MNVSLHNAGGVMSEILFPSTTTNNNKNKKEKKINGGCITIISAAAKVQTQWYEI